MQNCGDFLSRRKCDPPFPKLVQEFLAVEEGGRERGGHVGWKRNEGGARAFLWNLS